MQDVLTRTPPPYDQRLKYDEGPQQFGDLRLAKRSSNAPADAGLMMVHGGFWRAKYDLAHAGHLCAALAKAGITTFNIEYRRVGDAGGGWPGSFEDVQRAFRFFRGQAKRLHLLPAKIGVIGHSAGGQLAIALAAHEKGVHASV